VRHLDLLRACPGTLHAVYTRLIAEARASTLLSLKTGSCDLNLPGQMTF
jgi:hypothetical protein